MSYLNQPIIAIQTEVVEDLCDVTVIDVTEVKKSTFIAVRIDLQPEAGDDFQVWCRVEQEDVKKQARERLKLARIMQLFGIPEGVPADLKDRKAYVSITRRKGHVQTFYDLQAPPVTPSPSGL